MGVGHRPEPYRVSREVAARARLSSASWRGDYHRRGTGSGHRVGHAGLFDAESISEFAGGYRFLVAGTGFLDPVGFAYSPAGRPPDIGGEDWYIHYDGPWWIWVESW